jgi:importin-7
VAIDFLRPGLETVLRTYLKIMDEIDFDELIKALQSLVDVYEDEIAPYAVSLCQTLGNAFLRLISVKGTGDDEDQETCLTAEGLMTAIRNVLRSLSGKDQE